MTAIWAHRGSRLRAPENTLEAFALAIAEGADGIELDVHLSADQVLVVRHDPTVPVGDTHVPVAHLTSTELRANHGVPTLGEVYDLVAPTGLVINVEAKTGDAPYPGIVDALVGTWRESGLGSRIVFSSFNHHTLLQLRSADADVRCAPLISDGLLAPWAYARDHGFDAMHLFAPILTLPGVLEGFASAAVAVRAWTVNDAPLAVRLVAAGIDAIITDDPVAIRGVL